MKKTRVILLILLIVLVAFRILLPYIVLKYVNNKLANLSEYYGNVEEIDIALLRGAYIIKDIELVKIDKNGEKKDTIPFFKSPEIDLSVEWRAIFKGKIVGELYVEHPVLNFVKGKYKDENVKNDTADFRQLVSDLMPLTINHFEISDGQIHYIDLNAKKIKIDVALKELNIVATNLSNVNDSAKLLPARLMADGGAYEGRFKMTVDFDALNKVPTFDMNAELTNINMVLLNDVLREYGNFDVKKGNFGLYTEFAAKEGEFGGYVKPVIKDLDVVQWNKEEGDFKQILWETIVGSATEIFQNQKKDELATKVPINGKFDNPEVNIWKAISYVLRNAFVQALKPAIDSTINIHKLEEDKKKTVLEKIFGGKKKNDRKEKK
jgi:hypothetical protein